MYPPKIHQGSCVRDKMFLLAQYIGQIRKSKSYFESRVAILVSNDGFSFSTDRCHFEQQIFSKRTKGETSRIRSSTIPTRWLSRNNRWSDAVCKILPNRKLELYRKKNNSPKYSNYLPIPQNDTFLVLDLTG